jgi:hypothetical protein
MWWAGSITVTLDRYGHLLPSLEEQLTEALNRSGQAAAKASRRARSRTNRARRSRTAPPLDQEIAPDLLFR